MDNIMLRKSAEQNLLGELAAVYVILNILDLVTTYIFMQGTRLHEGNPVSQIFGFAGDFWPFAIYKTLAAVVIGLALARFRPSLFKPVNYGLVAVCLWNVVWIIS